MRGRHDKADASNSLMGPVVLWAFNHATEHAILKTEKPTQHIHSKIILNLKSASSLPSTKHRFRFQNDRTNTAQQRINPPQRSPDARDSAARAVSGHEVVYATWGRKRGCATAPYRQLLMYALARAVDWPSPHRWTRSQPGSRSPGDQ